MIPTRFHPDVRDSCVLFEARLANRKSHGDFLHAKVTLRGGSGEQEDNPIQ